MSKIRHYERTWWVYNLSTTAANPDPFELIRSMTNDLARHTAKINMASKDRGRLSVEGINASDRAESQFSRERI